MTTPERMVALHVITRMVKGGAQENTLANVLRADPARYRAILVTGPSDGPEGSLLERARSEGADVRLVPSLVREVSPAADLKAMGTLVRIMRQERPTIVHTHTSKAGLLGRLAARIARVPVVIHTPHGHVFHGYFGRSKTAVFIALERICARFTDRLVMLTENERKDHLALRIAPPERFVAIHSGVDFSRFVPGPARRGALRAQFGLGLEDRILGTVGRLVPIKGQTHLIAALPTVLAEVPKAHLVLVGSGPLDAELRRQARDLGVESHVHFTGLREDIENCLIDFDLFVLPSLNEGMGRVIVEAMAMRLPIVASAVSGIQDLVQHERNGLLAPPGDPDALAAAVLRVFSDPALAACFGEAGYATAVPNYSVDNMIAKIEALYREATASQSL